MALPESVLTGTTCTFSAFLKRNVNLRVLSLPLVLTKVAVDDFFSTYGEILASGFTTQGKTHLQNGGGWYKLAVSVDKLGTIPDITCIEGFPALVVVAGLPPLCLWCDGRGHIRRDCKAVACFKCNSFSAFLGSMPKVTWADRMGAKHGDEGEHAGPEHPDVPQEAGLKLPRHTLNLRISLKMLIQEPLRSAWRCPVLPRWHHLMWTWMRPRLGRQMLLLLWF